METICVTGHVTSRVLFPRSLPAFSSRVLYRVIVKKTDSKNLIRLI